MTLNSVNDRAQSKFQQLRSKFKLDVINALNEDKEVVAKHERLTEEEFQEFSKLEEVIAIDNQKLKEVDDTFDFIDSLKLSENLSLAIGLLISGHKTKHKEDYDKAIAAIQKEILKYA